MTIYTRRRLIAGLVPAIAIVYGIAVLELHRHAIALVWPFITAVFN